MVFMSRVAGVHLYFRENMWGRGGGGSVRAQVLRSGGSLVPLVGPDLPKLEPDPESKGETSRPEGLRSG